MGETIPSGDIKKKALAVGAALQIRANLTEYQFGRIRLYDQKRRDFVPALRAGGARLLVGTDTPNSFVVPGFSMYEELANLIDVGLTPFEAIRAATSGAAEFLKGAEGMGQGCGRPACGPSAG
jgi:imidazolonepropionase-like amidohydrolase